MNVEAKKSSSKWFSAAVVSVLIFSFVTSCVPKKKVLYFNQGSFATDSKPPQPLKCQQGDILDVKVYSINADIVAPFNKFLESGVKDSDNMRNGYLVGEDQCITLPLIGKLQVGGLTLNEIDMAIALRLDDFVKDPIVSVKLLNFEVTVLGEVQSPGLILVQNAQTNLLEVLGMAGDISLNGIREDIIVIRNEDGKRKEFHLDITNKSVFDQEGFYIHQNDIIYVSPNSSRRQSSAMNTLRSSIILTFSTLLGSLLISLLIR